VIASLGRLTGRGEVDEVSAAFRRGRALASGDPARGGDPGDTHAGAEPGSRGVVSPRIALTCDAPRSPRQIETADSGEDRSVKPHPPMIRAHRYRLATGCPCSNTERRHIDHSRNHPADNRRSRGSPHPVGYRRGSAGRRAGPVGDGFDGPGDWRSPPLFLGPGIGPEIRARCSSIAREVFLDS
jgi:hypothetical protein